VSEAEKEKKRQQSTRGWLSIYEGTPERASSRAGMRDTIQEDFGGCNVVDRRAEMDTSFITT